MNGTTRCPHCETRFKIAKAQLSAHQGMVRCGHCLQAFDARPNYLPEQASPQINPPIGEEIVECAEFAYVAEDAGQRVIETQEGESGEAAEKITADKQSDIEKYAVVADLNQSTSTGYCATQSSVSTGGSTPSESGDTLDFSLSSINPLATIEQHGESALLIDTKIQMPVEFSYRHTDSAEQVGQDDENGRPPVVTPRIWPWATGMVVLSVLLMAQSIYFYRVSLAAQLTAIKPALLAYCQLLNCTIPLPQQSDLMSIESSSLDADAGQVNQITFNALLRNRASYTLAFPVLALTLNDNQDKPLARRLFLPGEYLPTNESEQVGLLSNHEVSLKLSLHTADLKAAGYRLELFYNKK